MSKVERFEDLKVWQAARESVAAIYEISANGSFSRDYALRDQIRRAAVSVPSNIAEGFSRHSNKEFIQFLFFAKGSAAEVQSQLYTALDQKHISQEQFDKTYGQMDIVAKQISRFITYLRKAG
jgi:four helix bundle protein